VLAASSASCGADVTNLAVNASDAIDAKVGPHSAASHPQLTISVKSTLRFHEPDGTTRVVHSRTGSLTQYIGGSVPPSIGYTVLQSSLTVDLTDSEVAAPLPGVPHWSCRSEPGKTQDQLFSWGVGADGQLEFLNPPTLSEFATSASPDCSGVVALIEPGSQSRHDLWLLIIGAGISIGAGLLIDSMVRLTRRRRETSR
jgi:hypothetical protein